MKKNDLSQHEKSVIEVLSSIVAGQTIEIKDAEGVSYRSMAKPEGENLTVSYLYETKNGKEKCFLKVVYDHDSGKEETFWQ